MIRRLGALPRDAFHLGLMLALTFSTGVIDAVGYLGLDRVFTGNMTGNVVVLGMALVGGTGLPVLGPLLALVGFMAGAAFGGRMLKSAGPGWTARTTVLFTIVGVLMLGVAALLLAIEEDVSPPLRVTVTTVLGAAMGIQAATARFIAVKDVTTVVVTSTLTGLAADSVLGSGKGAGSARRTAAVILILAGAFAGGALLKWHLGGGLLLAGSITLAVTLLGALHARHHVPAKDPTEASSIGSHAARA
ncbi:YoaK family protein [Phycicoccus sp. Root101]|uniref:YoaK family protein n=1 Tax=Phycicoccus sp. Root101 TaxID=1736421 RepID=UPI0009E6B856|nr:YoaK family protein [Phycicoccus sp. Root101]